MPVAFGVKNQSLNKTFQNLQTLAPSLPFLPYFADLFIYIFFTCNYIHIFLVIIKQVIQGYLEKFSWNQYQPPAVLATHRKSFPCQTKLTTVESGHCREGNMMAPFLLSPMPFCPPDPHRRKRSKRQESCLKKPYTVTCPYLASTFKQP